MAVLKNGHNWSHHNNRSVAAPWEIAKPCNAASDVHEAPALKEHVGDVGFLYHLIRACLKRSATFLPKRNTDKY
jgi:hypothetical protein